MFKEGSQFEPGQAPEPDQTAILAGILRIWEGLGEPLSLEQAAEKALEARRRGFLWIPRRSWLNHKQQEIPS